MKYFFSPSTNGFYPDFMYDDYLAAGTWPEDALEVTEDEFTQFSGNPPDGKMRGNIDGRPAWVDLPQPTKEQYLAAAERQKSSLLSMATQALDPLRYAVELDMATDEEKLLLTQWKKYIVLLNRVDTSLAPDIDWPKSP